MISKDTLWKGIIENLIDDFIWYFFPTYAHSIDFERPFEFLDTELQKLMPDNQSTLRRADKLIKAWFKDGAEAWFLVHVEVQGYSDPFFAIRMFECIYRIRDKFQRDVSGLAIYTDGDQRYHFKEFRKAFLGSEIVYRFNAYVLRDHLPAELALDPNPFAAVMETAWQQLDKPKNDQQLLELKLDLVERLQQRRVSQSKIDAMVNL